MQHKGIKLPMTRAMALISIACFLIVESEAYVVNGNIRSSDKIIASNKITSDTTKIGTLEVPHVGIGTISWQSDDLFSLKNMELEKVVASAYGEGAAFIDTAERYGSHAKTAFGLGYGETEKLTSKLLHKANINQGPSVMAPVVATKFTPIPWRTTAQSVVDACEQSRKNLGVDQIDLYQIHMPDVVQPLRFLGKDFSKDEIYWDGLAECYHRGLVKNVGVCNYGPTLVERCQEELGKRGVPLASNQIAFSLLGRHNGAQETVDKCNELGVKVLACYPFAMGLLTGKHSKQAAQINPTSGDDSLLSAKKTKLELQDIKKYANGDGGLTIPDGGIDPLITTMLAIAEKRGKTVAQVALNYIMSKNVVPIPGCRSTAQLEENLGALGWRLTETEVKMLELEAEKLGFGFDGAGFKRTGEKFVGYGVEKFRLE
jgi:pyridoxine 4-dehydrogenase